MKLVAAILCAVAAGPVLAQGAMVASTQDVIRKAARPDDRELRQSDGALRHMVRCIADRLPAKVDYALSTEPGTALEERALESFQSRYDGCVIWGGHSGLRFPWTVLRGAFAEEMLGRRFPAGIPVREAEPVAVTGPTVDKLRGMMAGTARCVVAATPAKVDRLVRTEPFSDPERRAFAEITPAVSACLDTTYKATFSRQSLRALLADALYSYAVAGRIGGTVVAEKK